MQVLDKFTIGDADAVLNDDAPHWGPIQGVVLHHTYRPNQTTYPYRGRTSLVNIRRYHMNVRDWSEIGANYYVAPTGEIWVGRPLFYSNYCHAVVKLDWEQVHPYARALAYPNRSFFNQRTIGIEMIANFDDEPVRPIPLVLETALQLTTKICQKWGLDETRVIGHREVSNKSCPGKNLGMDWVRDQIASRLTGQSRKTLKIVSLPGSKLLGSVEFSYRDDMDYSTYSHIHDFVAAGHDPKIFIKETPREIMGNG